MGRGGIRKTWYWGRAGVNALEDGELWGIRSLLGCRGRKVVGGVAMGDWGCLLGSLGWGMLGEGVCVCVCVCVCLFCLPHIEISRE